ncbi:unnamed protein product [Cyclocybe aegerita]|uniref:Peptidase A1 domain-containing protein n=1 Tax=Cyclocybe aegerita TaxID=1973307 RepID=A0A8S0Y023_CYCAE|nr:unnamed protein product [Cyclocybe aegerita]
MRPWSLWMGLPAVAVQVLALVAAHEPSLEEIARRYTKRTAGGIHLPIVRRESPAALERRAVSGIGLGNFVDIAYTVLITIGGTTTPLILDTGSSDMWVMSDGCTDGCGDGTVPVYPQASFQSAGIDAAMFYGDSRTGTFAAGLIGRDTVDLAGLTVQNQYFAAINQTNTTISSIGAAGIFGLGFPINSVIWNNLFVDQFDLDESSGLFERVESPLPHPNVKFGSPFPKRPFSRFKFPTIGHRLGSPHGERHAPRQVNSVLLNAFESWNSLGPFLPRLVNTNALTSPMVSVTLQRNTVDIGGNVGMLSIGELPSGVNASELTWVPLRAYDYDDGGIPGPPDAPNEIYPITWEVMLDDVYLDGEKLPRSTLSSSTIGLSALIDTGNSLLRGPADVVAYVQSRLGNAGLFACDEPHLLEFEIGGKRFPVDPRDFVTQAFTNNVDACYANLVSTDPPRVGGYQFSWSLGTPFLKGVLSSYYFGNLTYPSQDQPRIGFLSTVPSNANDLLRAAVASAARADDNFPAISQVAPSGTATPGLTDSNGIPQATAAFNGAGGAFGRLTAGSFVSVVVVNAFAVVGGLWLLGL